MERVYTRNWWLFLYFFPNFALLHLYEPKRITYNMCESPRLTRSIPRDNALRKSQKATSLQLPTSNLSRCRTLHTLQEHYKKGHQWAKQ